ncbi:MAG: DUF4203 domain-containing protein [Anaerolineae bacterium]|nr:DUF4203 domain-containing protein [Anaerolineae bacterium]
MFEPGQVAAPAIQGFNLLVGIIILVAGRRLFWLVVGAAGFLTGLGLAFNYLNIESTAVLLLIGLVAGIIGIVVALFLQKVAIIIAGFFMGGYFAVGLFDAVAANPAEWQWLIYIVGGIVGAILVSTLFEYALIVLSAVIGASLITEGLNLSSSITAIVWLVLVVVGLVIQARTSSPSKK